MVACELGETEVVQELLAQTLIDVNAVDNVSAVSLTSCFSFDFLYQY